MKSEITNRPKRIEIASGKLVTFPVRVVLKNDGDKYEQPL
jgi:hypothetical protein